MLVELLNRLEAATCKLEEIALNQAHTAASGTSSASTSPTSAPASGSSSSNAGSAAPSPVSVEAYDELLAGPLAAFLDHSERVGGIVKEQALAVKQLFAAQRHVIQIATQSKKPDLTSPVFADLLKPMQQASLVIIEFREKNRPSSFFNHLSTVSEGIPALGWVAVEPKPFPFVGEMRDAAQFYSNRVIKEFKDKDRKHVEWAGSFLTLLTELQNYVKKHHTTGLVWNPSGADPQSFVGSVPGATSPTKSPAGAAPPPPPAPAPGAALPTAGVKTGDISSLFGELNRGASVTSGLKKVDKSQMTHKNPELRTSSVVKADALEKKPVSNSTAAQPKAATKLPPKTQLEGNKWVVENHTSGTVVLDQVELKQVVYVYGCTGTTIQIKGKVNTVSIDNCKKCGVVAESTVAGIDLVNCKSMQVQVTGYAPTVSVDKTDGCQIFMSQECVQKNLELFTAKCSEVNLCWPEGKGADQEFVEKPVSEQFKTVVAGGKVHTVPVEHKG